MAAGANHHDMVGWDFNEQSRNSKFFPRECPPKRRRLRRSEYLKRVTIISVGDIVCWERLGGLPYTHDR
jgi:hypothetical protein